MKVPTKSEMKRRHPHLKDKDYPGYRKRFIETVEALKRRK